MNDLMFWILRPLGEFIGGLFAIAVFLVVAFVALLLFATVRKIWPKKRTGG